MRICLVNPPHEESLDAKLDPPLGLLYIASAIKRGGYDASIIDLSFHSRDTWRSAIPCADIYGITVMTASLHHAINIKDIVKEINPRCRIIVGGAHPTSLPEDMIKLGFDIVIAGEGEGVINDAIEYLMHGDFSPRIFYAKDIDIDSIPFPDRSIINISGYTRLVNGERATSIIASRGCPYSCAFCINSARKGKVRFRSVSSIIDELKYLIKEYGIRSFIFYDDTFTIHPDLDKLLEEILILGVTFRCNGNARRDRTDTFRKLHWAGCREISFGIESGSQEILDIINKKVTVEQNKRAILEAKDAGLIVKAFLMIGSPGESWSTINETVKFMQDVRPQLWTLFNFVPLPGCDIWNNPEKYHIKIITKDYRQFFNIAGYNTGGLTVETEYMTTEEIAKARRYLIENLPCQIGPLQNYYSRLRNHYNQSGEPDEN